MRKRDLFTYVLCLCLFLTTFAGCTQNDEGTDVSAEASITTYTIADNSAEGHLAKLIEIANMDETEDSAFYNLSFEYASILEYGTRNFGYGDSTYSLIFFKIASAHSSYPGGNCFLCIEKDGMFTYYSFNHGGFFGCSLQDFDGDGYDEILIGYDNLSAITFSAANLILKVTNVGVKVLFFADGFNDPSAQINWVDTELEFTFEDNYTVSFRSLPMNYTVSFDAHEILDEQLLIAIYDEDGLLNTSHPLYGNYFEKDVWIKNARLYFYAPFSPIDIDNDGIYEIIAGTHFHYYPQVHEIFGTEFTLLKYNSETEAFEIIDVVFEAFRGTNWVRANQDYEVFGVPVGEIYGMTD